MRFWRRTLGDAFSEGSRRLWAAADELGGVEATAAKLGTQGNQLSKWLYGDRRPSIEWAVRIQDILGIPAVEWARPATASFIPPAARAA